MRQPRKYVQVVAILWFALSVVFVLIAIALLSWLPPLCLTLCVYGGLHAALSLSMANNSGDTPKVLRRVAVICTLLAPLFLLLYQISGAESTSYSFVKPFHAWIVLAWVFMCAGAGTFAWAEITRRRGRT